MKMLKQGLFIVGLWASFSVAAIERNQVWIDEVDASQVGVALQESPQAGALRDSLVHPWLNRLPGGTRLTEKRGEVSGLPLLHIPIATERFTQGTVSLAGAERASFYLNGVRIGSDVAKAELALATGDHQLLILIEDASDWQSLQVSWEGKAQHDRVDASLPERLRVSQPLMFDAETTEYVAASPNGEFMVWRRQHFTEETGVSAQVDLQVFDVRAERTLFRWQDGSAHSFAWNDDSERLAFIQNNRIRVLNLSDLSVTTVSAELAGARGLTWLSDSRLIFSWNKSGEQDGDLVKRYRALEDRWSYFRDNSQLFVLNTNSRAMKQVTEGSSSISFQSAHRNGQQILVTERLIDYREPAHYLVALREVDLASGDITALGEHRTFNQAFYVNDDIYVVAGPEFGDGAGRNLPDGYLANNYDGQLYRLSRGGEVTALSLNFNPAISSALSLANGDILLSTTDRDRTQLYRYRTGDGQFSRLNTGVDVVNTFSASQESTPQVFFAGSEATKPSRMGRMALNQSTAQIIWDSAPLYFRDHHIHDIREWNFQNEHGDTIYGRVYLPPNFNPRAKYPALVYYYGGTTPVQRGFTGRYPFNQWAAQGYVVYVLQPTGTIGYGQQFSARHVNAWGEYTANDIIEGTKRFLDAHDFVDPERVGHLGASYGGFMTMLLATMTDIFSASMSHAGISNITSYWGQGWWGFLYSGEASKGSFPWNNAELYTQQSPVFHADKVTAPMLLIHGDADTNVPAGESHNMYTALKLLGKEVELVEYLGVDHHVIDRKTRFHWWDTYMAFFDKHLKGQPEWWNYLYPEP